PVLADYFLSGIAGGQTLRLSDAAYAELSSRSWPGNVRELRNAVEHAAIVARGGEIGREHLPAPGAPLPESAGGDDVRVQAQLAAWAQSVSFEDVEDGGGVYERF